MHFGVKERRKKSFFERHLGVLFLRIQSFEKRFRSVTIIQSTSKISQRYYNYFSSFQISLRKEHGAATPNHKS